MDVNDIISSSMGGASQMVMGELYALEGNIPENRYRVILLKDAYIDAFACFKYSIETNNVILGVFDTEDAAWDFKTLVQTLYRDEHGNSIR